MRYIIFLVLIVALFSVASDVSAQCLNRDILMPYHVIGGDLLCEDLSIPDEIEFLELVIDSVICQESNYDFIYPFEEVGRYKIKLWLDNTTPHIVSICIKGRCGTVYSTVGFSEDGINPSPCSQEKVFLAGSAVLLAPITLYNSTVPVFSDIRLMFIILVSLFTILHIAYLKSLK